MFIKKKVEYHTVSTHDLYKLFTYTDSTIAADGITIQNSIAPASDSIPDTENSHSYNFNFLKHNFYSVYNNPGFFSYKSKYYAQNNHILQESASLISIPLRKFGKRILQGSVVINDGTQIVDDGFGNLIDTTVVTSSLVPTTNLKAWFSFDDGYVTKQFPYKTTHILRDNSVHLNTLDTVNPKFSVGVGGSGYKYDLHGNSYASIPDKDFNDFNTSNFTIGFWLNVPPTQSILTETTNIILTTRDTTKDVYPFEVRIYNSTSVDEGKLLITRQGTLDSTLLQTILLKSSVTLNDGAYHHVAFVKNGTLLTMYIDGVGNSSVSDYTSRYETRNASKFFIGGTPSTTTYLSGSIDELRIYDTPISVTNLHSSSINTNIVGSIFYEKGIIAMNTPSHLLGGVFNLQYRSVTELTENEVSVMAGIGEFNLTMNPSLRKGNTSILADNMTSSFNAGVFVPYITGIGLYDDDDNLLATAKLRAPIKSIKDVNLYFKIRFDM